MGNAKSKERATRPILSDEVRVAMLGEDPFTLAYNLLYGMVEAVYTQTGGVNHELIGMDFVAGKPFGVSVLKVRRIEDVPQLRERMLQCWPMVGDIFEAWAAPDTSIPAREHPLRYDIVSIMLNTSDRVAAATCRVDPAKKSIERAELVHLTGLGGRLGRELPTQH